MKGLVVIIFVLFFQCNCTAQELEIKVFAENLKARNFSSNVNLLKSAFRESHRLYLQHYKAYSETSDIFKSGNFDCLSGTLFFSALLDNLGFQYKVFETNYHIFLIANTSKGEVLIESTDQINGFVKDRKKIADRLNQYTNNITSAPALYLSRIKIFNQVNAAQMKGLVFFNKAVSDFLNEKYLTCTDLLEEAKEIYDTPRISEFSKILIQQIAVSNLSEALKEDLIPRIKSLINEQESLASR